MSDAGSRAVRFGVVGIGVIGKVHIEAMLQAEGAELVAVCDILEDRVNEQVRAHGVRGYTNYREMLQQEDIDVINICTPSGMHADMIIQAAEAGKHVICEKPLDITVSKIDEAVITCKRAGVKLAGIFQRRLVPENLRVKRAMDSGILGKLVMANARVLWYRSQEYYDEGGWRDTWEMDGGGALMNQSIHTIDLLQGMAGPVKSVYAKGGAFVHDIETEDLSIAVLSFENGAIGSILGTTCAYPGFYTSIELVGSDGTIIIKDDKIEVCDVRGKKKECQEILSTAAQGSVGGANREPKAIAKKGHVVQVEDMVKAIQEKREPIITGEAARNAVCIIRGIYESMKTGKEVMIQGNTAENSTKEPFLRVRMTQGNCPLVLLQQKKENGCIPTTPVLLCLRDYTDEGVI